MKLSFSAFFLVLAGCSKTAATADAVNDTAAAAAADAVASTKVKAADKAKTRDPNANITVTVADIDAAIAASTFVPPVCTGNEKLIQVDVFTDLYPSEITWTVDRVGAVAIKGVTYTPPIPPPSPAIMSGGPYSAKYTLYQDALCVQPGVYTFTIYVSEINHL